MGSYSKQYRATAAPSVGANWSNAANIYDTDANSYSERSTSSTSATHINGFGINLPSNAVVESVEVHTKAYLSNTRGYLYVYLYSDSGPTVVKSKEVANGASLSAQYVTQTYTADELIEVLSSKGLHNGSLIEFLKNARVRFVIGSTSSYLSSTGRIYDNYLVVNYKIPDYTLTVTAGVGGSVTGGGVYESGTSVTLTATPNTGYKFKQWSDGNTNATRTVTVTANATYTAQFEKVTVAISANVSPSEGGTVTGTGIYEYEETYTLTAVPNEGYKFVRWSTWDTSPSITRTARTVDEEFIAYFEKEETSNIFIGNQRVSAYLGTQKVSVYIGTQKLS